MPDKIYPTEIDLKKDIIHCSFDYGFMALKDSEDRYYRIKDHFLMLKIIKGEVQFLYPRERYGNWHLLAEPPKQKKLKEGEKICHRCNGHGSTWFGKCDLCNTRGIINWIQVAFEQKKEGL